MFCTLLRRFSPILWLLFSLSALPASSQSTSPLTISGFGTLGLARSTSPDVEFVRDLSQPRGIKDGEWSGRLDTILGVQANWQVSPELEVVTQVVSRYQHDESRNPVVDWAFLKWVPDDRIALRAGRIGSDLMLLADSRSVGYSSLRVRPPTDFFGLLYFTAIDGVDGSLTMPLGNGLIRGKLFAGLIEEKVANELRCWDTSGSEHYGLLVDYFSGVWQFRASTATIRFSNDRDFKQLTDPLYAVARMTGVNAASSAADALSTEGTRTRFHTLGTVYDNGPLQVQIALNKITHETGSLQNSVASSLLAGYRIKTITPYVGISRWKSSYKDLSTGLPDTPQFAAFNSAYQEILDSSGADQTTYTAGVRWDVRPKIALKLQWDVIQGSSDSELPYAGGTATPDWNGRTEVLSVTMDFVF